MKRATIGILAHVDAGKTTLTESMLYHVGAIKRMGRVDRGDAFLDTHSLERERGITIFSKMATLPLDDLEITLLDTPGHIDFVAEVERSLEVLDGAILVLSLSDPIRSNTKTLWTLLRSHRIPTFIFVNKCDMLRRGRAEMMEEIRTALGTMCAVDFSSTKSDHYFEDIAAVSEKLLGKFFDGEEITKEDISGEIARANLFPVYFGSALSGEGVGALLEGIHTYLPTPQYSDTFGAKVHKIMRDADGTRLTYLKITGGTLRTKDILKMRLGEEVLEEKIEGIRLYSGEKYRSLIEAKAGMLVAVQGLTRTYAGQGFGVEYHGSEPTLTPLLSYRLNLPDGINTHEAYLKLLVLHDEDPTLALAYDERNREITVMLMGEMQLEILKRIISERFGLDVTFSHGDIVYKETIKEAVFGSGHFEPLRHYAEVHLLIEPLEYGEGVVFKSELSTDILSRNYQRLILSHLEEKTHRGVLTGSALTDVSITLVGGRAHNKHTEGGDFRKATYRAVRQGLMKAENVLLEPYMDFILTLPEGQLGRAMSDLDALYATLEAPDFDGTGSATLRGYAPLATIRHYQSDLRAYTKGEGAMTMSLRSYLPCHNTGEVVARFGYNPTLDERNPPHSVFYKNGTSVVVPWDEADAWMHAPVLEKSVSVEQEETSVSPSCETKKTSGYESERALDKELLAIFERTYGKIKRRQIHEPVEYKPEEKKVHKKKKGPSKEIILVDGYNIIFAWETLAKIAKHSLIDARDSLVRMLSNYAGYRKIDIIVVFDAYLVRGGVGSCEKAGEVFVVYTKEKETADAYIEKTSVELAKDYFVRVATSDATEQMIILGAGAYRVSAREFEREILQIEDEIATFLT